MYRRKRKEPLRFVLGVLSLYSMSGDASGKPTPSYKEILRSKDKAVSEANTLLKGERKDRKKISISRKKVVPLCSFSEKK